MQQKSFFLVLSVLVGTLCVNAQDILSDMPNVHVIQDSAITRLMNDKREGIVHGQIEMTGWRVQVYSSNNQRVAKSQAEALAEQLGNLLDVPVYVVSQPPFWKVRIGNFLTQEEAIAYRDQLLTMMPEYRGMAYVVKDEHIQVMQ